MASFTLSDQNRNPYGVLPSGNLYFASEEDAKVRSRSLGKLVKLPDEALLAVLEQLNERELAQISQTSRILYVFSMTSDLWRDLLLRRQKIHRIQFINTWRDTFVLSWLRSHFPSRTKEDLEIDMKRYIHRPIVVRGMFSNYLHRLWTSRLFDLESCCPGFLEADDVTRIHVKDLSVNEFLERFERPNIPVVITGAASEWPAMSKWDEEYLKTTCGEFEFRATSATAPDAATFTMKDYFQYAAQTREEAPLYLFDRDFTQASEQLALDYSVLPYFDPKHNPGADLFRVLGEVERPDYRWLTAGPQRSGSIFHIDPNQTNAWNVSIVGRKKWIFYPPGVNPPGVVTSADEGDLTVPISTGEWLLSFWRFHLEAREMWPKERRPLETIANPGDLIFVPNGYWHMVVNLDDCIALTQNYVSTSNLSNCLRFLRDKEDQISGVRDRLGSIKPENLYKTFIDKLRGVLSDAEIDKAVEDSKKLVSRWSDNDSKTPSLIRRKSRKRQQQEDIVQVPSDQSKKQKLGSRYCGKHEEIADSSAKTFSFSFAL